MHCHKLACGHTTDCESLCTVVLHDRDTALLGDIRSLERLECLKELIASFEVGFDDDIFRQLYISCPHIELLHFNSYLISRKDSWEGLKHLRRLVSLFIELAHQLARDVSNRACIHLEGQVISPSPSIKVLGMHFQQNRTNTIVINRLKSTVKQVMHMLQRIISKTRGMGEEEALRLVQAFVVSRVTYSVLYALLTSTDIKKIDTLLRKAYKRALGLPISTYTDKLLKLGLHNTTEDLIEAHLTNHRVRLSTTTTGRTILSRLGINSPLQHQPQTTALLPKCVRSQILVQPLPRNMHPIHNAGRRAARAKVITKQYGNHPLVA